MDDLPIEEEPVDLTRLRGFSLLARTPMEMDDATVLASVLKALAEPTRLRILSLIATSQDGQITLNDLKPVVGLSQPTLSHHLRILVMAGLLVREKVGVWNYYSLTNDGLATIAEVLTPVKRQGRKSS